MALRQTIGAPAAPGLDIPARNDSDPGHLVQRRSRVVGRSPAQRAVSDGLRWAFLLPAGLALLLTTIFPLCFAIISSFLNWFPSEPYLRISFAGVRNYVNAVGAEVGFLGSLGRTLLFVVVVVTAETIAGLFLALLLNQAFKGRAVVIAMLSIPMMLTPVALAYIWKYMFDPQLGIINATLSAVGIQGPVWLQSIHPPWLSLIVIMVVDVWEWTPFMMLLCLAALASVPDELIESARIDGARRWQMVWQIYVPMVQRTLMIAALIRGIVAFKEFDKVYVLTGGGPGTSTELVSFHMFEEALQYFNFGETGVMAVILTLVTFVFVGVFLRLTRKARAI